MSIISKVRKQDAVWWPMIGRDRYGEATYADPVEIKVRWVEKSGEVRGPGGSTIQLHATIMADSKLRSERGLKEGDLLWLGKLDDFPPDKWSAPKDAGADDIKDISSVPNLRNTETLMILGI